MKNEKAGPLLTPEKPRASDYILLFIDNIGVSILMSQCGFLKKSSRLRQSIYRNILKDLSRGLRTVPP